MMDLLGAIVIPVLILVARDQIHRGIMTLGAFFTFIFALLKAYTPLKRIGTVYQQFQAAQGASTQVFAYLDLDEEHTEQPGAKTLPPFSQRSRVRRRQLLLRRRVTTFCKTFACRAQRGEVIALVGSSGAGKTTLVNLIPRFYEATAGHIRIDGIDIRDVTIRSLREQIAMVAQENILFHDTVWNNICYGLTNVPKERVEAAARAALASDFIAELPQGYRHRHRRTRHPPQRRPAPAHRHRPRHPERFADPDSRRSHFRTRRRIRNVRAESSRQSDGRPHHFRHRPPLGDHSPRR